MEPSNIEKQIQTEFQNRRIQPSAAAWDRLDAMLTIAEKPKKSFVWWQVAAGFTGFLLLATALYFQSKPLLDQQNGETIVTIDSLAPGNKIQTEIAVKERLNEEVAKTASLKNSSTVVLTTRTGNIIFKSKIVNDGIVIKENGMQKNDQIAPKSNVEVAVIESKSDTKTIENQTQIQQPKYINPIALLADIENKSISKNVAVSLQNQSYKINAKSLLTQVDDELETSFRQRVVQKINKSYQTAKLAVADRNNAR